MLRTKLKSLANLWEDFENECVHPEAVTEQREDFKLAFYSGAADMYDIFCSISEVEPELTEDELNEAMDELAEGIDAFFDDLDASCADVKTMKN